MAQTPRDGSSLTPPASSAASALSSLSSVEGEYACYFWKNVVVSLWFGPSTLSGLANHDQHFQQLYERHPEGISVINIVVPGKHTLPPAEVREELKRFVAKYSPRVVAAALVIPVGGFWASALRGVATALMLVGHDLKLNIFATTREVAAWLPALHLERTGVAITTEELAALLERAQRAHT